MNIEIQFDHFLITEMNYKLEVLNTPDSSIDEFISLTTQGNIGIQKEFNNLYIELITDIKTTVEEKDYRTLNISVQFFFEIENKEEVQSNEKEKTIEMLNEIIENKLIFICQHHLQQIIRQITSIDYNETITIEPINNKSFS